MLFIPPPCTSLPSVCSTLVSVSEIHTATIGCHDQRDVLYRRRDDGIWRGLKKAFAERQTPSLAFGEGCLNVDLI